MDEKKYSAPSLDTSNTLAPQDTHDSKTSPIIMSPSGQRADANRLNDDLELLRVERQVSKDAENASHMRTRVHNAEPEDAFNQPAHSETMRRDAKKYSNAKLLKLWVFLKKFPRSVRYVLYLIPGAALLLVPVLLGALAFNNDDRNRAVGGVKIMWFGIWLEIVWATLWVTRMITSLIPHIFHGVAKLVGSTAPKKWRDVGFQLELHTALFLWLLAVLISFKPTTQGHRVDGAKNPHWIDIVNKVIIALFTLSALNFVEKILIQWIATSFHQRTYATRIDNNKSDIRQLVVLYENAKANQSDYFWQSGNSASVSGAQTPMQALQDNARVAWNRVGVVANRVGNDLIGRKVDNNHPRRVVAELMRTTQSAHTLARIIYRSLVKENRETVHLDDIKEVFESEEEAEAAFAMFDKDMNGDISIDEFEAVCNEIHLEKKAIAASLKDLDSVVQKLDKVFLFIIVIITIIVFISILSNSAATALGSAGTVVLGLAWVLQATAQEFLQSIIFVFIKHPFDVGDRVTVYGSTGDAMMGDDYYVTEISLLYTEFKQMQGHIVQAPNSLLNTVFILNHRRSNGLADVVELKMQFGTPAHMIEELKARMLEFCLNNKRDYQPRIISEMSKLTDVRSCTMNIIFFHKSSYQNELLRLNRHNKFLTELMAQMVDIGIQSPYRIEPGGSREHPLHWTGQPPAYAREQQQQPQQHPPQVQQMHSSENTSFPPLSHKPSTYSARSSERGAAAQQAMDAPMNDFQDVFENRRDTVQAHRLASIREKDRAERKEQEAEDRASSSGVERVRSSQESRTRAFLGRPRRESKSQQQGEIV